jgi:hypothetical protein
LDKNSVTIVTIGNGMMVESTIIDGTMRNFVQMVEEFS